MTRLAASRSFCVKASDRLAAANSSVAECWMAVPVSTSLRMSVLRSSEIRPARIVAMAASAFAALSFSDSSSLRSPVARNRRVTVRIVLIAAPYSSSAERSGAISA